MIDTVVLTMPASNYIITEPDRFQPSFKLLKQTEQFGGRSFIVCKQNPTKSDYLSGNYLPRLTITKRFVNGHWDIPLKIEFSAPKLLFGNNFDELQDYDFDGVIMVLNKKLKQMGVCIFEHNLRKAMVSAIHYSKNIVFTDGTTASMIVREVEKVSLTKRLDFNKTDFRNSGYLAKFHANSYEVVVYDKVKELNQSKKSEKRSESKDNMIQLNLFQENKVDERFECFRIEIRLSRVKLRSVLKNLGIKTELNFEDLFNEDISKMVIKNYWKIISDEIFWTRNRGSVVDIFNKVHLNNDISITKAMMLTCSIALISELGSIALQDIIANKSTSVWYRLKKDMKNIVYPENSYITHLINQVSTGLDLYLPVKLKDYKVEV